ncbi:MAG TPA: (p)ppGpp synthetase [Marmoricola sp.]
MVARERSAVRAYSERLPALRRSTDEFVALITSILDEAGINYLTVTGRAKSVASFAAKAARTGEDGAPVFPDPLQDIADQIGIRVITYVHRDVQAVAELLADQVEILDDRDMGEETASQGRFGYQSRHLLIGVDGERAQIQIRTVLQHAWAEFEHDIRYKGTIPEEHVPDFDRRFTLAAGLLELADREFSTIRDRLQRGMPETDGGIEDDDPRIPPRELAAFLAGQYDDSDWSRTDHYVWIAAIVLELGITSVADLGEVLRTVDDDLLAERMAYRHQPGAVRRLDDALLWAYGDDYIRLRANAEREAALRTRLAKMRG